MRHQTKQAKSETRSEDAELVVLSVLSEEPLYGYAIAKKVEARSEGGLRLTPGLLYPLLAKLERTGMLEARWEEVKSERRESPEAPGEIDPGAGRRRKWYELSSSGRARLEQRIGAHQAYLRLMSRFVGRGQEGAE